jgi:hypothetical protein
MKNIHYWNIILGALCLAMVFVASASLNEQDVEPPSIIHEAQAQTLTVEQQIRQIAKEENFQWTDYLVRLAYCESRLDPNATNTEGNSAGIDRGVFQINSFYHSEVSDEQAFDVDYATRWTINMINEGRQTEWVCDKLI